MKSASPEMELHLQQRSTSLTTCFHVTRTDGQEFFLTELDHDLDLTVVDGHVYRARSGYSRSSIENKDDMSVDGLSILGIMDANDITQLDLERGLFDYAEVRMFLVNYRDPSMGIVRMRRGWLGEVKVTDVGFFFAELRGLLQKFSTRIGELTSPECRAQLGGDRCKVPLDPPAWATGINYLGPRVPSALPKPSREFRIEDNPFVSDWARASVRNNRIFMVTAAGRSNPVEPTWDTVIGNTTSQPWAGFVVWTAAEVVVAGTVRRSTTTPTDKLFVCTTPGTTGAIEPVWNTVVDGITNDNGVVWTTYPLPPEFTTFDAFTREGEVDGSIPYVPSRRAFQVEAGDIVAATGFYNGGAIVWVTGDNAGRTDEIRSWINTSAAYVENVGSPNLDFDQVVGGNDRLVRDAGSFIADGFVAGMRMIVSGSPAQDGVYGVLSVTATILTIVGDWPAENLDTTGSAIIGSLRQIILRTKAKLNVAGNDQFLIMPGCLRRLDTDCKLIFKNVINFRGEPYVPGQDKRFSYPNAR